MRFAGGERRKKDVYVTRPSVGRVSGDKTPSLLPKERHLSDLVRGYRSREHEPYIFENFRES